MKKSLEKSSEAAETYRIYVKTSAVGIEVTLCIGLGIWFGDFADNYFASSPWGLIIGATLGTVAAARAIYYFVKKYLKTQAEADKKEKDGQ